MSGEIVGQEDMDSTAIMRRAFARGERAETLDPNQLVAAISEFLTQRGLHPELPPESGRRPMAVAAAGKLLRAFGIVPSGDFTSIDRHNAPDSDLR